MGALKLLSALLVATVISGCATMNETECMNADWQETGYADGINGEDRDHLQRRTEACAKHGITPLRDEYHEGYEHGLEDFCTSENGYEKGRRGYNYKGICPQNLEGIFLLGYNEGRILYDMEQRLAEYENAIAERARQIENINYQNYVDEGILTSKDATDEQRQVALNRIRYRQRQMYLLREELFTLQQYRQDISTQLMNLNRGGWGR